MNPLLPGQGRLVAVAVLAIFALAACGGGTDSTPNGGATAGNDAVKGLSTPAKISVVTAK